MDSEAYFVHHLFTSSPDTAPSSELHQNKIKVMNPKASFGVLITLHKSIHPLNLIVQLAARKYRCVQKL